jgi:hypothetical protein
VQSGQVMSWKQFVFLERAGGMVFDLLCCLLFGSRGANQSSWNSGGFL